MNKTQLLKTQLLNALINFKKEIETCEDVEKVEKEKENETKESENKNIENEIEISIENEKEIEKPIENEKEIEKPIQKEIKESKYLSPAELLFYLSTTFEHDDYYKYIKWLSNKINNPYTIKECLIHNGNKHDYIFDDFTTKLLINKNMVDDYHEYKQSFTYDESFKSIKIYNSYLTASRLLNTILVYQHDKLIYREIYQPSKSIYNAIDYEYHICKIEKCTKIMKLINNLNEIYSLSIHHNPFTIINRKYVEFDDELTDKIYNTLNNEKIMNEVYDVIKNIKI